MDEKGKTRWGQALCYQRCPFPFNNWCLNNKGGSKESVHGSGKQACSLLHANPFQFYGVGFVVVNAYRDSDNKHGYSF